MRVVVDSTVWSLALRRKKVTAPEAAQLTQLIQHGHACIIGPVRQEVLSGVGATENFIRVRDELRAFPDLPLTPAHFEAAANCYNTCRSHGIQASNTDFLLCAVSIMDDVEIFTTDRDFEHLAKLLPVRLYHSATP